MSVVQGRNHIQTATAGKSLIESIPDSKSPEPEEVEIKEFKQEIEESTPYQDSSSSISTRAEKIGSILASGSTVSAVLLKNDGSLEELKYDSTPSKHSAISILNSRPTIVGSIESINVIILRGLDSNSNTNQHSLPKPFARSSYPGDYLLLKVNKDGNIENFSKKEYEEYVSHGDDDSKSNDEVIISSQSAQSPLSELKARITETVISEFKKEFGVDPSQEEIDNSVEATLDEVVDSLANEDDSLDYTPGTDESRFVIEETAPSKYPGLELDEYGEHEFHEAIEGIKRLATFQRDQIIRNVQKENGVSYQEVVQAFSQVSERVLPQNENEYDSEEKELAIPTAEFEKELTLALKNVRALGHKHGRQLACSIADTFSELNGISPTEEEVGAVFSRMKAKFNEEAFEELLDDDSSDQQVEDDGSAAAMKEIIGDLTEASKSDILEFARRIVREDLAAQAHDSFLSEHGRIGDEKEIQAKVNELASVAFKDQDFGSDEDDNDYDVNEDDLEQQKLDEEANYVHEIQAGYHNVNSYVAESNPDASNLLSSPVKDVGKHGSVRIDFYVKQQSDEINELNYDKMLTQYKKFHNGGEPSIDETQNMIKFLETNNNLMVNQFDTEEDKNDGDYNPNNDNDNEQDEHDRKENDSWEQESREVDFPLKDANVLHTKIKNTKKYARVDFYFEQDGKVLLGSPNKIEQAKDAYKIFNHKDANGAIVSHLKKFTAAPKPDQLVNEEDMVNID